jgi:hypothetical protein
MAAFTVVAGMLGLVTVSAFLLGALAFAVVAVAGLILAGGLVYRATRVALVLSPNGLIVQNLLRRREFEWREIERIDRGTQLLSIRASFSWTLVIRPTDHRTGFPIQATAGLGKSGLEPMVTAALLDECRAHGIAIGSGVQQRHRSGLPEQDDTTRTH